MQLLHPSARRVKTAIDVIENLDNTFDGDLKHDFRAVFYYGTNLRNLYHHYGHLLYITWYSYEMGLEDLENDLITTEEFTALLQGAFKHDVNHSGGWRPTDDLEIEAAWEFIDWFTHPRHRHLIPLQKGIVKSTEFPPPKNRGVLTRPMQIIGDADRITATDWIWQQNIIFNLPDELARKTGPRRNPKTVISLEQAEELRKMLCTRALNMLRMQSKFLGEMELHTDIAKRMFSERIDFRIEQSRQILRILEEPDPILEEQALANREAILTAFQEAFQNDSVLPL